VVAHLSGGPNGTAIEPDDYCYICNNSSFSWNTDDGFSHSTGEAPTYRGGSIQRVNLSTRAVETLDTECDGKLLYGPNDLVFDAQGGVWFTKLG
jgi:gluconolactonase